MTEAESKQLKVGDRVKWLRGDGGDGDVIETGYGCVKVRWDDNYVSNIAHVDGSCIAKVTA